VVAFIARPLGMVLFLAIDRNHGRRAKREFSRVGLVISAFRRLRDQHGRASIELEKGACL